jgi:hypothetical protein
LPLPADCGTSSSVCIASRGGIAIVPFPYVETRQSMCYRILFVDDIA